MSVEPVHKSMLRKPPKTLLFFTHHHNECYDSFDSGDKRTTKQLPICLYISYIMAIITICIPLARAKRIVLSSKRVRRCVNSCGVASG